MNKEEILAKSRAENKNGDERERDVIIKAGKISMSIGGAVGMIWVLIEQLTSGSVAYGIWAMYTAMLGSSQILRFVMLKKKRDIILGIINVSLCIAFFVVYFTGLVK